MWQVSNQRRSRSKRENGNRISLHIRRVEATVTLLNPNDGEVTTEFKVRLILNDISENGMGFFAKVPFTSGQKVRITIQSPLTIQVKGAIQWCQHYDVNSHVISSEKFSYRMGVQFYFENEDDRTNAQVFFEELTNLSRLS